MRATSDPFYLFSSFANTAFKMLKDQVGWPPPACICPSSTTHPTTEHFVFIVGDVLRGGLISFRPVSDTRSVDIQPSRPMGKDIEGYGPFEGFSGQMDNLHLVAAFIV